MKTTPNTITAISKFLGATAKEIRFKHAAAGVWIKRKGYAFIDNTTGLECLVIEPKDSLGDKWLVTGDSMTTTVFYAKNTGAILKRLRAENTTVRLHISPRGIITVIDNQTNENWANEYFYAKHKAIAFCKQNHLRLTDEG